jgi:hypothetical protein
MNHNIVRRPARTWTGPEPGDYYRWSADEQNHWPPSHDADYNSSDVEESTTVLATGLKEEILEEEEEVEYLGECVHPSAEADQQFEEDYYDENDDEISIKEEEDQCGTSDTAAAAAEDLIGSDILWQQFDEKPPFIVETEERDKHVAYVKPTHLASNNSSRAAAVVPPAGVPSCLLARPATRQLVNYWQLKHQQWRSIEAELKIPLAARDQEGGLVAVRAG